MFRKLLIGLAVLVVLLVGAVGTVFYVTFGSLEPLGTSIDIRSAHTVIDGYVAAFLLEAAPGKYLLVDAGSDPDGKAILAALEERGAGPEDVIAILLTHGHPDHIAAVGRFPNARVFAHEEELALIEGMERAKGPLTRWFDQRYPTHVTDVVGDAAAFKVGNLEIVAFHVPGHTAGSTAYLIDGVLFLGDAAVRTKDGTMAPAAWIFSDDVAQDEQSLENLGQDLINGGYPVEALAFSHSAPFDSPAPLMRFRASRK